MGLFDQYKESAKEIEKDYQGSSFKVLDTNLYKLTIDCVYVQKPRDPASKALKVVFKGKTEDGTTYTESFILSTRAGSNKDSKGNTLSGFKLINNLIGSVHCGNVFASNHITQIIKVYDWDTRGDVDVKAPVFTELTGKEVYAAIVKKIVFKAVRQDDGTFRNSSEKKEVNNIQFFANASTKLTASEIFSNNPTNFAEQWLTNNKDRVVDSTAGKTVASPVLSAVNAPTTVEPDDTHLPF